MCQCGELDPSYVCVTHRDTRFDPYSDPDRGDPYNDATEPVYHGDGEERLNQGCCPP